MSSSPSCQSSASHVSSMSRIKDINGMARPKSLSFDPILVLFEYMKLNNLRLIRRPLQVTGHKRGQGHLQDRTESRFLDTAEKLRLI
ncbi:hypothetical protein V1264_004346 [Littorina saxatilis]|uniref:Uncharacterized protein n=1 Tax=Littorina saxatilis TaxID=31220 RepID=A0AAN9G842_9CAEN